jgi:hypothetical protein
MVSENCCGQLYVLQKEIIIMIIIIKNKEIFLGDLIKKKNVHFCEKRVAAYRPLTNNITMLKT